MPRPVLALAVVAAAMAMGGALAGCSSAAAPSPPSGIDGLTIPTPDPDPADFTADVTNPWLPLAVGSRWTYATTTGADGDPPRVAVRVAAEAGPVVDGVATTAVRTRTTAVGGGDPSDVTDFYAQDLAGNVWWFGHQITSSSDVDDVAWEAGVGGAEPGLAMAATPRLGDGYVAASVPHQLEVVADVKSLLGQADTVAGTFPDAVVVDVVDRTHDTSERSFYARGIGLVAEQDLVFSRQITLVTHTPG